MSDITTIARHLILEAASKIEKKPRVLVVMAPGMWQLRDSDWADLKKVCHLDVYETKHITEVELAQKCFGYDYLMLNMDPLQPYPNRMEKLTEKFYNHPNIKTLKGINVDMVDADFFSPAIAKRKGILLQSCPNVCTRSVAESALTEILLHAHNRHRAYEEEMSGKPIKDEIALNLFGKTAGIIGYGHIGSTVASMLKSLGMKVLVNDIKEIPTTNTPIEEIFKTADVISIHIPAIRNKDLKSNIGFIDSNLLNLCNKTIIVNLAIDVIVDCDAMVDAIRQKKVVGYSVEPSYTAGRKATDKLKKFKQVHISPTSYNSEDTNKNMRKMWLNNTISAIKGNPDNVWK